MMKNPGRVFFSTLVGLFLVALVCALQPTVTHGAAVLSLSGGQAPAAEQTVSGKIASVEKNSFTLTVGQQLEQTRQEHHHRWQLESWRQRRCYLSPGKGRKHSHQRPRYSITPAGPLI